MALIPNSSLQGIDKATRAFNLLEESIKATSVVHKKLVKDLQFKTSQDFKNLDKEIKQVTLAEKELIQIENEKIKLLKQEEQLLQAKNRTQTQVRKEQERQNKEQERQVKIAKRLRAETKKASSTFERQSKTLKRLTRRFKDVALEEGRTSKNALRLERAMKRVQKRLDGVSTSSRKLKVSLSDSLGSVTSFATGAGAIAGGVLLAGRAISSAVNIVKDFEQAGANLAATLGDLATEDNINKLGEDAKRLGASTAFSATQVRSLQTEFAKLGFNPDAIVNATEATLNLAAATGSDLAEAAAIAGATLGGFGLAADQTQRVTDLMAKSFSISALDINKFKESMKTAAPAARAVGVSVEETTAILGTLAKAGISGSKAGTSLATAFINLNEKGLNLEKGLEKVSASSDKLGTAVDLVGKEAAKAFLVLAEGTEITKGYEESLIDAAGAAKRMADIQLDTLNGSIKILNSSWEGLILSMDDGSGVMSDIAKNVIQDLSKALAIIAGESKEAKKEFSFLGTVLTVIKTSFEVLIGVVKIFLTPLKLMIDGIIFLGEAIVKAARRFEFINKILGGTGGLFTLLTKILNNLPEIVDKVVDRVIKSLTRLVKFDFKGAFSEVTTGISDDIKELLADVKKVEKGGLFTSLLDQIKNVGDKIQKEGKKIGKKLGDSVEDGLAKARRDALAQQNKDFNDLLLQRQSQSVTLAKEVANEEIERLNMSEEFNQKRLDNAVRAIEKETTALIEQSNLRTAILLEKEDLTATQRTKTIEAAEEERRLILNAGQKRITDLTEKAENERLELIKKSDAERKKILQDGFKQAAGFIDKGAEAQRKAHQERLNQFDEEIAASRKLQDSLAEDARRGVADAEENLVFARQKEREATLERIQEVERQKRVEEGLVFLKLLASNAGNSNIKNPVITSIAQFTAARLFISALSGFYDGTDNVGKSLGAPTLPGKDGHVIRVDGSEQIWSGKDVADMNNKSREEIKDLAHLGEQYKLGRLNDVSKKHKELHIASSYMSNDKMLGKMDELIESNNNAYKKIKQTNWSLDALGRLVKEHQDERGRKNIDTYEEGGIF